MGFTDSVAVVVVVVVAVAVVVFIVVVVVVAGVVVFIIETHLCVVATAKLTNVSPNEDSCLEILSA